MLTKPLRTDLSDHELLATTLQNVKQNLRIDSSDTEEDSILTEYIKASSERLERWLGMDFLFGRNISYYEYCSICTTGYIITKRPFFRIEKFEYLLNGVYTELAAADYILQKDGYEVRICPKSYLGADCEEADPVKITYVNGFARNLNQTGFSFSAPDVTVTAVGHGLAVGDPVYVEGADQADYNGIHLVSEVVDADNFKYQISTTPAAPTGTIIVHGPDVPSLLQLSIKQMVAAMYANRGDCSDECGDVPCGVQKLARSYRKMIIRTAGKKYGCVCC